jgi:phosphate transport system ATP-binding protein
VSAAFVKRIEVQELRLAYDSKEVLHGISFDVYQNEILAVIGPAQSGKSSMLRCLNRTIDFTANARMSGTVRVDGEDVRRTRDVYALRRKIGMVAPLPVGLPLTIYDNVAFAPRSAGLKHKADLDAIVERCLRQAALWDEVKDRLFENALGLSGGQQQRLCIARAIAVEPDVILMDEPCSALDPIATLRIEELMRELRENYTIVIVTHNMQQAARVSDTTAFLTMGEDRAGYLVEMAPTEQLFTQPANPLTEEYITGRFG